MTLRALILAALDEGYQTAAQIAAHVDASPKAVANHLVTMNKQRIVRQMGRLHGGAMAWASCRPNGGFDFTALMEVLPIPAPSVSGEAREHKVDWHTEPERA